MNHIAFIAFLCVYTVILIVLILKAPKYALKVKHAFKTRKKRKEQYIKNIVYDYLIELKNEKSKDEQIGGNKNPQSKIEDKKVEERYIGGSRCDKS